MTGSGSSKRKATLKIAVGSARPTAPPGCVAVACVVGWR